MLTTAVVSSDAATRGSILKALERTGLVDAVREWDLGTESQLVSGDVLPDLIVLDLSADAASLLAFAAHLCRLRPMVRIIACSARRQADPAMLLQAMRSGVQDLFPLPADVAALRDILTRFLKEKEATGVRTAAKVIVVLGAKGGVGTTTVAVNVGVQLAQLTKKRIVLLDFASPIGNVSVMLGLQPRFSVRDAVENLGQLDRHVFGALLTRHQSGLEVLAGMSNPGDWQRTSIAGLKQVANAAQNNRDLVVLDLGAHYLSEWVSLLRTARVSLFVTEATVPSLWSLERQLSATTALGIDPGRIRIIINRWDRDDDDALRRAEKKTKCPIFARLPNDFRRASEAMNAAVPLSGSPDNSLATKFRWLAGQLTNNTPVKKERRSSFGRLFSRHAGR